MKKHPMFSLAATLIALTAQTAHAGAPLKCIQVKCRTSEAGGAAIRYRPGNNKGGKSAQDDWSAQARKANKGQVNGSVTINSGGAMHHAIGSQSTGAGAGKVNAAKVKSHSNTNNN